jgi:hypothetical protein
MTMSVRERSDLQLLLRQREKVLKAAAKQRSAELLADFENHLGQKYAFDQDEVWKKATIAAKAEIEKANRAIAGQCAKLGIPARFAPEIEMHWYSRGENASKERRAELRKMAMTRIAAIESAAIVEIGKATVEAQMIIAASGLASDAAKAFLDRLPPIEGLMPALSYEEVAGEADPPIVEQLISPNALRQRRWRERNAVTSRVTSRNSTDEHGDGSGAISPEHPDGFLR